MTSGVIGPNQRALDLATERTMANWGAQPGTSLEAYRDVLRARGVVVGTTDEVIDTLGRYAALGLDEVDFQPFNFDSDEIPEYIAAEIAPRTAAL
jgi:alkanesulfonate monooxygenase SsuD/methylene tetrahydromethanopterin reductase-like flavin-dependent oxidoreductase (luciferase family)